MIAVAPATDRLAAPVVERPRSSYAALWLGAAVVFAAVSFGAWLLYLQPNWGYYWHQVDLQVYMWGGRTAAVRPDLLYTAGGPLNLPFLYPVFAAWICAELSRFSIDDIGTGMSVASVLSLFTSVWCAATLLRYRRGLGMLAATLAVGSVGLWLEPVQQTFQYGQVSVILMAAVLVDLALPERRSYRGILIGIATGIKLTPAVFIVYLLITRQFKAAGVAIGAFAVTVAIGFWYLPPQAAQFWTSVVAQQNRVGFAYVQNQSINGVLGRLQWTTWDNHTLWLLAAGLLGLGGLAAARVAHQRGDDLLAILLVAAVSLLCSPISWTHYWVWMIPALMWAWHTMRHLPLAIRAGVPTSFSLWAFAWPMQVDRVGSWDTDLPLIPQGVIWFVPQTDFRESHWTLIQFLTGNSYTLLGLAALLAAIGWLLFHARAAVPDYATTPSR
ncbi:glycosyltransferase 87 family protein [Nocardia sp. NBC_01730]|uniref:glycosyltransferase 87 family protein n=1 Tax=Nocardia sp. NBC_01730 TaxID=2975998 RepID=UPI002E0F6721|nr:glycosyltransferase 87 family protein [Nocardia sp. NBC_01730]